MRSKYFAFFSIFFISNLALASNQLEVLKLNKSTHEARVCASKKIFIENENFYSPDHSGYVIVIYGQESDFDNFKDTTSVCALGTYRIDSKGFAPHIYIDLKKIETLEDVINDEIAEILPENNLLAKKAVEIAIEWADGNISTGTSRLRTGKIKSDLKLDKLLSEKNFKEEFELDKESLPQGAIVTTVVKDYSVGDLNTAVTLLASSNDYSPECKACRKTFRTNLSDLLSLLGKTKSIITLKTSGKFMSNVTDSEQEVSTMMFVNKNTKKAIRIFTVEGSM